MIILFCEDPIDTKLVDSVFSEEGVSAHHNGHTIYLINHDEVEANNPVRAIRKVPTQEQITQAIYRGWMIQSDNYKALYEALLLKNIRLINSPIEYDRTHYLPNVYPYVNHAMVMTTIIPLEELSDERISEALNNFSDKPLVIKDYVKSQAQGYWHEACFIPKASDKEHAFRVIHRFIELQGHTFAGGLILREYKDFQKNDKHEPIERRVFILNGEPVVDFCRNGNLPSIDHSTIMELARKIPSNFFTMDFALADRWVLLETGDGQVSSLNNATDALFGRL